MKSKLSIFFSKKIIRCIQRNTNRDIFINRTFKI